MTEARTQVHRRSSRAIRGMGPSPSAKRIISVRRLERKSNTPGSNGADEKSGPAGWNKGFRAGAEFVRRGSHAKIQNDFVPYLRSAGVRSKLLEEARNLTPAWNHFLDASGRRLGFNHMASNVALRTRFRKLYVHAALFKVKEKRREMIHESSFSLSIILIPAISAIVLASSIWGFFVILFCSVLSFFILTGSLLIADKLMFGRRVLLFLGFAQIAGAAALAWWLMPAVLEGKLSSRLEALGSVGVAAAEGIVVGSLLFVTTMLSTFGMVELDLHILDRRQPRMYPDVIIFSAFVTLLEYLQQKPAEMTSLKDRREISRALERAARAVEYGLRNELRLPDAANDLVLQGKLRAIAATIRSYQVPFAMAGRVTHSEISRAAVATIRCVCLAEFESLPILPISVNPSTSGWKSFVVLLTNLAIAIFPVSLVTALVWVKVMPTDALGRTVIVAAVIWAVVSLLMTLDPSFASRVSATRDLVSVLRGESKAK